MRAVYPNVLREFRGSHLAALAALLLMTNVALSADAGLADGHGAASGSETGGQPSDGVRTGRASRPAANRAEMQRLIERIADRHGVEAALVCAVVAAESAYDINAVSPAGAIGLMQLMPATALDYGVESQAVLFDPAINVDIGVRHLKRLLRKYHGDYGQVIMAYNAGEGVVDRTNANVRFAETLDYTQAVARRYRQLGGSKSMAQLLAKVSALRRQSGATRMAVEAVSRPATLGVLPTTSARLRTRLPSVPLDALSLMDRSGGGGQTAGRQSGIGLRRAIDPVIRDAARGASFQRDGVPVVRW